MYMCVCVTLCVCIVCRVYGYEYIVCGVCDSVYVCKNGDYLIVLGL